MTAAVHSLVLFALIAFVPASALWQARHALRPLHLAVLGVVAFILSSLAWQSRGMPLALLLFGFASTLAGAAFVFAVLFMAIARSHPPPPVRTAIDGGHKTRSGAADVTRSFALPQTIALVVAGLAIDSPLLALALPVAALFAGLAWIAAQRRLRAIRVTPTSRIATAAQGYVELAGRGRPIDATPILTPILRHPCLWFRYRIEEKRGKNWRVIEQETCEEPLRLVDESGEAIVDPAGAQVVTGHRRTWREGKRRFSEEWLAANDTLYVLGDFATERPRDAARAVDVRAGEMLNAWKRDPAALRARFDRDGDGEISLLEWDEARETARRQARAERADEPVPSPIHRVRAPKDGRPFIIGNRSEDAVRREARRSALLRMAWFGLLVGGSAMAIGRELQGGARTRGRRRRSR